MTATDELRRLLDERGVKWWEGWDKDLTCYDGANGVRYLADAMLGEMFFRSLLPVTPDQAVEVTLGRGTCEIEYVSDFMSWHCKACDQMDMAPRTPKPRFCKWCGREVFE